MTIYEEDYKLKLSLKFMLSFRQHEFEAYRLIYTKADFFTVYPEFDPHHIQLSLYKTAQFQPIVQHT